MMIKLLFFSLLFCTYGSSVFAQEDGCKKLKNLKSAWALAGAPDSCLHKTTFKASIFLNPNESIQEAIEWLAHRGGGLLHLGTGDFLIDKPIVMKSNIVLRGSGVEKTKIISKIRTRFEHDTINMGNVVFQGIQNAGLEYLSLIYRPVSFEPKDFPDLKQSWSDQVFVNNPHDDSSLYVSHVVFSNAKHCWVKHCHLLQSGTDPIFVSQSHFNTFSHNTIDRCYNKGGEGNGYYVLRKNSSYNLVYADTVKRIRHFAIEAGAHHNVVLSCYFEVDVNFHNGDGGSNLIEHNIFRLPKWHGWGCFAVGVPYYHKPPGSDNMFHLNKMGGYKLIYKQVPAQGVYEMNTNFDGKPKLICPTVGTSMLYQKHTAEHH